MTIKTKNQPSPRLEAYPVTVTVPLVHGFFIHPSALQLKIYLNTGGLTIPALW
jgi:hypothetical protein